jgi:hypothetical protein
MGDIYNPVFYPTGEKNIKIIRKKNNLRRFIYTLFQGDVSLSLFFRFVTDRTAEYVIYWSSASCMHKDFIIMHLHPIGVQAFKQPYQSLHRPTEKARQSGAVGLKCLNLNPAMIRFNVNTHHCAFQWRVRILISSAP